MAAEPTQSRRPLSIQTRHSASVRFRPIADIRSAAHIGQMRSSNDNEELPTLRYFMTCYWHQNADLVDGDLSATAEAFASQEKPEMVRSLLADLAEVGARGLFAPRWPRKGPLYDFWSEMGGSLSDEDAELIAGVAGRHLS